MTDAPGTTGQSPATDRSAAATAAAARVAPPTDDMLVASNADEAEDVVRSGHRAVFARMGRNVGWLLGGRGFAGLASIGYLAIAARALGPVGFGEFALILAYGGSIANLVQFKSWQAVVRFGSVQLAEGRHDRLARLFGFTATLDAAGALIGALVAVIGVRFAAPLLGWSADAEMRAAAFGAMLLFSTGATASGMLRLFNRFDLQTYAETVGPSVRLGGGAIAWMTGAGVDGFLIVWATAAIAEGAAGWLAVALARLSRLRFGRTAFMTAARENPRLWTFMLQNNVSSSIGLLWEQLGTLAVGATGGPAAAGAFRVASKLAGALAKPVETVTRALYPELARMAVAGERLTLRRVVGRVSLVAGVLGLLLVIVTWQFGPVLLRIFSGKAFEFAQLYLLPLTVAAAIDLWGTALEPLHNAYGRSGRVLAIRLLGAATYAVALVVLLDRVGTAGAAFAVIAASVVIRGLLALSARPLLDPGSAAGADLRP